MLLGLSYRRFFSLPASSHLLGVASGKFSELSQNFFLELSRFSSNHTRHVSSLLLFVFVFIGLVEKPGRVTFHGCCATAQRYLSHAAQMPCVTTASRKLHQRMYCELLPTLDGVFSASLNALVFGAAG